MGSGTTGPQNRAAEPKMRFHKPQIKNFNVYFGMSCLEYFIVPIVQVTFYDTVSIHASLLSIWTPRYLTGFPAQVVFKSIMKSALVLQ